MPDTLPQATGLSALSVNTANITKQETRDSWWKSVPSLIGNLAQNIKTELHWASGSNLQFTGNTKDREEQVIPHHETGASQTQTVGNPAGQTTWVLQAASLSRLFLLPPYKCVYPGPVT